jgi:hypothetical protein
MGNEARRLAIIDPIGTGRRVMERRLLTCPTTGRDIDPGIAADIGTRLRLRPKRLRTLCPPCDRTHDWDARLGRTFGWSATLNWHG